MSIGRTQIEDSPQQKAAQEIARRELDRRAATKSLAAFCARMDDRFVEYRHTRKIIETLEALTRRDIERAMVFCPPRHGKSYICSERYPAFLLGARPREKVMLVAYNSDLAQGFSRKARDLISEPFWPFDNVRVSPTLSSVGNWATTTGGEMLAGGFGGTLAGKGATCLVIDDPIKNPEEANSPTHREKIWDFYATVVRTRMERNCTQLIMLTRWNEDDLAGRLLNSPEAKEWFVLEMPVHAEENDPLGRAPGELLWPEGPPIPRTEDGVISKRMFAALYQQRPTAIEGDLFKRAWFQRRYKLLPAMKRACIFIDGAWKDGVQNDYSAMAIWGDDGLDFYLIDAWRGKVEYPDLKQKVKEFYMKHREAAPTVFVCVEDAASGMGLVQELKRERFPRIPISGVTVDKAKYTRAESVTPLFESGKCVLPENATWLHDFVEEHVAFPGVHDDYVDTTSGALTKLSKSTYSLIMGSLSTIRRKA